MIKKKNCNSMFEIVTTNNLNVKKMTVTNCNLHSGLEKF